MNVEIEWQPDDQDATQTLYADLTQADIDAIHYDRDNNPDAVLSIPSRVEKRGPARDWIFRAGRIIEVRRV